MIKEINEEHHPALGTKAVELQDTKDVPYKGIVEDLIDTLESMKDEGSGLAANQIWDKGTIPPPRIFAAFIPGQEEVEVFINPKGTGSGNTLRIAENCLSFPNRESVDVKRKKNYTILYINKEGEEKSFKTGSPFSRVLQHEMDHLDGVVIYKRRQYSKKKK